MNGCVVARLITSLAARPFFPSKKMKYKWGKKKGSL